MSELAPLATTNKPAEVVAANLNVYFKYADIKITQSIEDTKVFLVSQAQT